MKSTSAKFAGAANALHAQANQMNRIIAEYIAAGHMAAWHAAYAADPDALPPPPVNPNYAFTPPPPALLQKGEKSSSFSGQAEDIHVEAESIREEVRKLHLIS